MTDKSEELVSMYNVVFAGTLQVGASEIDVKDNLRAQFNLSDDELDALFSGKSVVVKKAVDEDTGNRVVNIFEQAGALCKLAPVIDQANDQVNNPVIEKGDSPMKFAAQTDIGHKYERNEDSYACCPELNVWLVADGMGGGGCGEVASSIVVEAFKTAIANGVSMEQGVIDAHNQLRADIDKGEGVPSMRSTLVALRYEAPNYEIVWLGDSRAYAYRPGEELQQLSKDHSFVQELIEHGVITPEQARTHPRRNVVTQAMGSEPEVGDIQVGRVEGEFSPDMSIILCSDGLNGELTDAEIAAVLEQQKDLQPAVDELIQLAVDAGGNDNITAILINSPQG